MQWLYQCSLDLRSWIPQQAILILPIGIHYSVNRISLTQDSWLPTVLCPLNRAIRNSACLHVDRLWVSVLITTYIRNKLL